jgi:hypothetical protein
MGRFIVSPQLLHLQEPLIANRALINAQLVCLRVLHGLLHILENPFTNPAKIRSKQILYIDFGMAHEMLLQVVESAETFSTLFAFEAAKRVHVQLDVFAENIFSAKCFITVTADLGFSLYVDADVILQMILRLKLLPAIITLELFLIPMDDLMNAQFLSRIERLLAIAATEDLLLMIVIIMDFHEIEEHEFFPALSTLEVLGRWDDGLFWRDWFWDRCFVGWGTGLGFEVF